MAFRDFRDFLAASEQQGLLRRIAEPVDRLWAPAALAKWMFQALPDDKRFGLLFERVEGSQFALVTGALGASTHTYALALGVDNTPAAISAKWLAALNGPIAPRIVAAAPCQEVVKTGAEARLSDLPIPVWTPGKDAAPYITTITVNRDVGGRQNMGVYRTMVRDDRSVIANLNPGRQGYMYARTYLDRGKPAPIAWVIATEPVVHLATVANLPIGQDEIRVAGGLKGEAIEIVKCRTQDLYVPANAEIVIEGEVIPGETAPEGPFGEFAGFMGPVAPKPVVRITAITHRRGAIYYGYTSQMPPSESTVLQSLSNAPLLLKQLHDLGEIAVVDVHIDLTFGGMLAHAVVAMRPMTPGHALKVGRLVALMSPVKRVTVVDHDIDIRDPLHVEWCMNSLYNPVRDTAIIPDVFYPLHMDPSVRVENKATELGSKVVIDATQTIDAGPISLPSRAVMEKALGLWRQLGLPEFEIPPRVTSRLNRS